MENHIAALRKQRRLSQEELAQAVGVSRQTITSLEVGKYTASLSWRAILDARLRTCFCLRRNNR